MRDIIGYKELTEQQKVKINTLKLAEKEILKMLLEILDDKTLPENKWRAEAFLGMEMAFMCAVRAIANP